MKANRVQRQSAIAAVRRLIAEKLILRLLPHRRRSDQEERACPSRSRRKDGGAAAPIQITGETEMIPFNNLRKMTAEHGLSMTSPHVQAVEAIRRRSARETYRQWMNAK